jgi:selenocysteine lyase/cysteine desulfurase
VSDEFARELSPAQVGYMGIENPGDDDWTLRGDARRFEVGSVSPVPYAGLREGIATIEDVGFGAITDHVERLTARLKDGVPEERLVSAREYESGLVAIDVDDPERTVERLADEDVVVRDIPGTGTVRVSVHVFNSAEDVDALLDAL